MATATTKLYEGMFLVDSTLAGSDWDGVIATIENILRRSQAEILSLKKWGERRLAYEIDHKSRGTYILCYFNADGNSIREIERAVKLSDRIMRVLILKVEKNMLQELEADIYGTAEQRQEQKIPAETEKEVRAVSQQPKAVQQREAETEKMPDKIVDSEEQDTQPEQRRAPKAEAAGADRDSQQPETEEEIEP